MKTGTIIFIVLGVATAAAGVYFYNADASIESVDWITGKVTYRRKFKTHTVMVPPKANSSALLPSNMELTYDAAGLLTGVRLLSSTGKFLDSMNTAR